ncbi:MAG: DNA-processing protein DprA [Clostridiales bacterium]
MDQQEEKYLIGLAQVYDLTQNHISSLMRYFSSAEEAWHKYRSWGKALYLSAAKVEGLIDARRSTNIDAVYQYSRTLGVKITAKTDSDYTQNLENIFDAPYFLYYFGELPKEDEFCLTMIGSRKHSDYGRDLAKKTAGELVKIAGATIISGMAEGIDSISHWGALNAGGKTLAVLGNGIDIIYPSFNTNLYEEIKKKGCIISEFPLGYGSLAANFPRRNRLMSALGRGVIVVEAHKGSGVFHTVSYGLDQGKDIFAFPGSVFSGGSYAPHFFIREGTAKPVFTTEDILEEYFDMDFLYRDTKDVSWDFSEYPPEQRKILEALEKGELTFNALLRISQMDAPSLTSLLSLWEVDGLVNKKPGQCFALVNYIDEVENE